jgi:hypothetical protein
MDLVKRGRRRGIEGEANRGGEQRCAEQDELVGEARSAALRWRWHDRRDSDHSRRRSGRRVSGDPLALEADLSIVRSRAPALRAEEKSHRGRLPYTEL